MDYDVFIGTVIIIPLIAEVSLRFGIVLNCFYCIPLLDILFVSFHGQDSVLERWPRN